MRRQGSARGSPARVVALATGSSYNSYLNSWLFDMPKGLKTSTITDTPRPRKNESEPAADPTRDSLQLLLREAGRYPLLKPSEEIELAKRIEKGDLFAKDR